MSDPTPDVVVLREGAEGLSSEPYAGDLQDRLPERTVRWARTPHEERSLVEDAPVVTGVRIDEDILDRAVELEMFACAFAGTDHLPMDALAARDVIVTNASGIHAPGIAELAVGCMLTFARNINEGIRRKRNREWRHYQSHELMGSSVTIVGLGSIGRTVAERLEGFGVHTMGVRYTPAKGGPTDEVIGFDEEAIHDALARSDYVVIACPLTETTRGLIGEAEFTTLPPTAVIINVARGPIVDTAALVSALQYEEIRGAALDVTDPEPLPPRHPLWTFENVILTPHTGGHTPEHWSRLADIVARNVRRLAETGSAVDLDNVVLAP